MDDERYYATVTAELQVNGPIAGLWAKAFAEANGNESEAKARYLRYRVQQLIAADAQEAALRKAEEDKQYAATAQAKHEKALTEARSEIRVAVGIAVVIAVLAALFWAQRA